jgi:hypothetical protein
MATVTPNFNWPVPTSTDLVKDGATAIEALGDSIDASLVDLKGGTTGQVLSKASNTDMDFTWVTDAAGDITGVTAGTGISGGGTSGTVTVTNSMATAIDAKGDLIAGTAADTFSRIAVGTNGQVLTADSTAATGLAWATPSGGSNSFYAGKNKIINGDFSIWQRGTSFTNPASVTYNVDRWRVFRDGSGTLIISQQTFTPGTAPVAGYEGTYFYRLNQSVAGSGATVNAHQNVIEDVRTLAGQTVTLSYWAKAAATLSLEITSDQGFGTGGSSTVSTTIVASQTITTSWVRYSHTFTMPSMSGKTIGPNNSTSITLRLPLNATFTFDIWGVQLEAGSTATDFVTASGGSPQAELAMCQRYYFRAFSDSGYRTFGVGTVTGVNNMNCFVNLPVQMRVIPTSLETSAMSTFYWEPGGGTTPTSITLATSATQNLGNVQVNKNSSFTVGYATGLFSNNTAAYLGFSAEY